MGQDVCAVALSQLWYWWGSDAERALATAEWGT